MEALWLIRQIREKRRRIRANLNSSKRLALKSLRNNSDPFNCTEGKFRENYTLGRNQVKKLIEELRPLFPQTQRRHALTAETKVLCALHFFATGSHQKSVGSHPDVSLSQPSVSKAIKEVTEALTSPQMLTRYIHFPDSDQERKKVVLKNFRALRIPGVLGIVDCTQVAIRATHENEEPHVNSLNVQIVCDADLVILDVLARFPGHTLDSSVWKASAMRSQLHQLHDTGEKCWLLGDSGHPLEPWLLTPYARPEPYSPEEGFNIAHKNARNTVAVCIGALKDKFKCLNIHGGMEYDQQKAEYIVLACCVLHNMCTLNRYEENEVAEGNNVKVPVEQEDCQLWEAGERARAHVAQRILY